MMVYDRYFGWDWDRIRAFVGLFIFGNLFLSFILSTEGLPWWWHIQWVMNKVGDNIEAALILSIILLIGFYYWWRFEQGDF